MSYAFIGFIPLTGKQPLNVDYACRELAVSFP